MKRKMLVILIIFIISLFTGCGHDKSSNSISQTNIKDKFIGIWVQWDDKQTFMADNFVKNKYLNNENVSFAYVPDNNGLYVFNYIVYDNGEIKNRETVASKELYVEETNYEVDSIYNTVHMYRTIDLPEKIYFYRIYEKSDGTIYLNEESKEQYYCIYDTEDQKKEFLLDKYNISFIFENVPKLKNVTMSAYTTDGTFVEKYDISVGNYKSDYKVADNVKYVEFEELYVDKDGNEYSEKVFEPFNSDDWTVKYSCIFNMSGVGKKIELSVIH